jgi:tRNA U34 5-carboxymethylaminomethyl modifying GTPase MnmE/TrmE
MDRGLDVPPPPDRPGDALADAYAQRTKQLHEARGALAEAVSALTTQLTQQREELRQRTDERDQALRENRSLSEHVEALDAEIQKLDEHLRTAHEQNVAFRNMKVVRWSGPPRRFVYRLRARRG